MSQFAFHPDALIDLFEIWQFIFDDNPSAADRVFDQIYDGISKIAQFQAAGHTRDDLNCPGIVFHSVGKYLIACDPRKKPLLVLVS